jgi:hypothetical protein
MHLLRHRLFAAACALLLLTQAVLPRELVCCIQDGAASLELSNHGRCIGQLSAPHQCTGARGAADEQAGASGFAPDSDCVDQQILTPELRAGRGPELSAPACAPAAVVPPHRALDICTSRAWQAVSLIPPPERTVWKPPTVCILRI